MAEIKDTSNTSINQCKQVVQCVSSLPFQVLVCIFVICNRVQFVLVYLFQFETLYYSLTPIEFDWVYRTFDLRFIAIPSFNLEIIISRLNDKIAEFVAMCTWKKLKQLISPLCGSEIWQSFQFSHRFQFTTIFLHLIKDIVDCLTPVWNSACRL